ncbi:hypothetical protein [Legionella quateirensis]|uniref:Protein kinase domain containing protein n=1 Tax=Legionella quateirensis TaxID=45072 RepID=A0A378KSQ5_9GAMM|nr:hypothetical protein [Legionella quateirensis]KTD43656.1 protein kinase domain containing protein [Legionella quateirensis]STY17356.1 protein kinase domain containing protein [Legionella quateirensis]
MPMLAAPKSFPSLVQLVDDYNKIPEQEHIQRLFYLQKINYLSNTLSPNAELYEWMTNSEQNSFLDHLKAYHINPHASFFLKGIQFAQAVALYSKKEPVDEVVIDKEQAVALYSKKESVDEVVNDKEKEYPPNSEYALMQNRDDILLNKTFEESGDEYMALSLKLAQLALTDHKIKTKVQKQVIISEMVESKIQAVKGNTNFSEPVPFRVTYKTEPLGAGGNNANFRFKMSGWDEMMIFRVEDRSDLSLEQRLHSHPVSIYFIEDYVLFRKMVKNKLSPIEYRPVVLSQFANQGDLTEVAKKLHNQPATKIAAIAGYYFDQVTHFCSLLIDAKAYHPDIKLSNFLAHNNRLLISDRKTLIENAHPLVNTVRSSPNFAPDEYNDCLDFDVFGIDFNEKADTTVLDMPRFMAFQVGMILKEFLLLTQLDKLPDDFRNRDQSAASYFVSPPNPIINLSFLVQELTRTDPQKRMTIDQFKSLVKYRNMNPENFYNKVESEFPSAQLGIQDDIDEINTLLNEKKNNGFWQGIVSSFMNLFTPSTYHKDFLLRANEVFKKISESDPKETRLTRLAEKLAVKCYREYSHTYFKQCSQSLEAALYKQDWDKAPWYSKALYWLSFGLYNVERSSNVDIAAVKIKQDLKGEEFQMHFPLLEFLPPNELDHLGTLQSARFKEFLYSHVNEILPQDAEESEHSSSSCNDSEEEQKSRSSLRKLSRSLNKKSSEESDSLPSGTMVIKTDKSDQETVPTDSLPSGTMVIKKDETDNSLPLSDSLPSGTMKIKSDEEINAPLLAKDSLSSSSVKSTKKTKKELPSDTVVIRPSENGKKGMSFSFIKDLGIFHRSKKAADAEPKSRVSRFKKVDSVRTALLRGDGSNRHKAKGPQRLRVEDINWDPVTSDVNEPSLRTNSPQV